MIRLNLKKSYLGTDDNWFECINQGISELKKEERVEVAIEKVPFIKFEITRMGNDKYGVISISPVSLRTYKEQDYHIERWTPCDTLEQCFNSVISIVGGFINYMGKKEENDGKYYEN